jgi:hypothetical protein
VYETGGGGSGGNCPPPIFFGKPWTFGQMLGKIKKIRADLSQNILNSGNFITIIQSSIKIRAKFQPLPWKASAPYAYGFSPVWSCKKPLLEDFVHFVDDEFDFASFADLLPTCAKDVVEGLKYLHSKNIAHRDLKPGNILVSNQHYSSTSSLNEDEFAEAYGGCAVVCKLSYFCSSRSLDLQSKSFFSHRFGFSELFSPCIFWLAFFGIKYVILFFVFLFYFF